MTMAFRICEANQQLAAASFHCRRTIPSRSTQNLHYSGSHARFILRQVSQSLKREGLDDGTAVFQITVQRRDCSLSFLGAQREPGNHDRKMPAQLLLRGLAHQAQKFFLVALEELRMLSRDLLGGVCSPHSYQRICRPQTCDQC